MRTIPAALFITASNWRTTHTSFNSKVNELERLKCATTWVYLTDIRAKEACTKEKTLHDALYMKFKDRQTNLR